MSAEPGASFWDRFTERQMALGVVLFGVLLYLPFAGSYGLWDPWETHYGEVARQMSTRGDWISLWWPGSPLDGETFWSKPVFTFWIEAFALRVAHLGGGPSGELASSPAVEWALRTPSILFAVLGVLGVYLATARFVGRRAGVIAAVANATFPLYALVARQAITDMPFIGPMTMALALGAFALFDERDEELPRRGRGRLSWPHHPLFYGAVAFFVVVTLPQLVVNAVQLRWDLKAFGHAVVIPGAVVMIPYDLGFLAFLYLAARTRHRAPLYLYLAAVLCGIAMLAKGLAGLGIPVLIFLAYLGFTRSWSRLGRAQITFGILVSLLACAVVTFPWHHAMLIRHGFPFWDELYGDNHWHRLVVGRHGDRGDFTYFLRQLGYATLPWLPLAPAALAAAVMRPLRGARGAVAAADADPEARAAARRQSLFWFGAIWFVAAYALVSLSVTKFHHYILASLPGLAIVLGCTLDDWLRRRDGRAAAAAALVGLPLLALVIYDLVSAQKSAQHFVWLFSYDYVNQHEGRPWPPSLFYARPLIVFACLFAASTIALSVRRLQRAAVVALCVAAVAFSYFLLDVFMRQVSPWWSQKDLIATYYKVRRSPDEHLIAWQMYWRGENFYTENEIYRGPPDERTVFLGDHNAEKLQAWIAKHRGQRAFFVVERSRWATLQGLMPKEARDSLKMIDESNMKFCLAQVDL